MSLGTVRKEMADAVAASINASPDEVATWSAYPHWPTNLAENVAYIFPNQTNYLTTDIEGAGFGWCNKSASFTVRPVISYRDFDFAQKRLDVISEWLIDNLHETSIPSGQTLRVSEIDRPLMVTGDAGQNLSLFIVDIRLFPIPV